MLNCDTRQHRARTPLPPLYIFLRNLLHNLYYNPAVVTWVDQSSGCFRVTDTSLLAQTWGDMKQNRWFTNVLALVARLAVQVRADDVREDGSGTALPLRLSEAGQARSPRHGQAEKTFLQVKLL